MFLNGLKLLQKPSTIKWIKINTNKPKDNYLTMRAKNKNRWKI